MAVMKKIELRTSPLYILSILPNNLIKQTKFQNNLFKNFKHLLAHMMKCTLGNKRLKPSSPMIIIATMED